MTGKKKNRGGDKKPKEELEQLIKHEEWENILNKLINEAESKYTQYIDKYNDLITIKEKYLQDKKEGGTHCYRKGDLFYYTKEIRE